MAKCGIDFMEELLHLIPQLEKEAGECFNNSYPPANILYAVFQLLVYEEVVIFNFFQCHY